MICLNCKRQIPDNAPNCPNCGAPVVPEVQVGHEIKIRRWQRWIFYVIFIFLFLGAVGFSVYIYNQNTALMNASVALQSTLTETKASLTAKDAALTANQAKVGQLEQDLSAKTTQLVQMTGDYDTSVAVRQQAVAQMEQFKTQLAAINPNIFSVAINMSVPISAGDLSRIPLAEANLGVGPDSDSDGLSDAVEAALGTDPNKADSDGDTYLDKAEVLNGYDPLDKTKKLPIDLKFAATLKGKFVKLSNGDALWFVSSRDGKRYFLGAPATALKAFAPAVTTATPVVPTATVTAPPTNATSTVK